MHNFVSVFNVKKGKNVKIKQPCNLYNCSLGDDVFVGPFVEIQKNVMVGDRVRIQSHSFICELVTIGSDCFIGHGVIFTNDKFSDGSPARGDVDKYAKTNISERVYIGSGAVILPVAICSDVVIGAGAVVTRDILQPGKYVGNPAKMLSE